MDLVDLLTRWGVALVFLSVLLEQGGLPLPAAPVLVSAGALAEIGVLRPELVLLAAFVACFLADQAWFAMGRRYGRRVLATLCRVSLSPDTCVRRTDDLITRHGPAVLLVAKFLPGVSAVAIPTAASMGLKWRRFVLFDTIGCLMWCVGYVAAGMIFSREVTRLLAMMDVVGGWSIVVVLAILALYIGWRLEYRWRLRRLHRLVRISPEEIVEMLEQDAGLVIVDARSTLARTEDPRQLPRSILLDEGEAIDLLRDRRDQTIVTFCTCPNEASAAILAERLIKAGFGRVRVLTGGAEALELLSAYASGVEPIAS